MRKTIVDKWTTALRSGDYKQGKFFLHRDGKFCCLGVLCDIEGEKKAIDPTERARTLSYSFRQRIGISCEFMMELQTKNDSGATFDTIADYIEVVSAKHGIIKREVL